MIKETNKKLRGPGLNVGELLRFFGLWFHMSTTYFDERRSFCSAYTVDEFEGAPYRFIELMPRRRFDAIFHALTLKNLAPPPFKDRFWEVRQLMEEWNRNMKEKFSPSWVTCLDESMSKWIVNFTCPGFMCVPRKPWPMGNEYHTIFCGETKIMFQAELVEGKD